jgi:hypothetical protein
MKGMFKVNRYRILVGVVGGLAGVLGPAIQSHFGFSGVLKIAGIAISGLGLFTTVLMMISGARGRSKARQMLFDDLRSQVELARHPPQEGLATEIEGKRAAG